VLLPRERNKTLTVLAGAEPVVGAGAPAASSATSAGHDPFMMTADLHQVVVGSHPASTPGKPDDRWMVALPE
jgi:hypothetical protein